MPWTPLKDRLDELPLILCGPILRRTEPDSVTVWVALKEERTVTLRVYSRAEATDLEHRTLRMVGTRATIQLGKHLHVVAVTARLTAEGKELVPGEIYFYDLVFPECDSDATPEVSICLKTPGIVSAAGPSASEATKLFYPETNYEQLPSFSLAPNDLNKLRIIHGSCRKPHNEGVDAMPAIDDMLIVDWPVADERPHMLLLTGDQIYADDVSATLLFMLIDAATTLLGWKEELPGVKEELPKLLHEHPELKQKLPGLMDIYTHDKIVQEKRALLEYIGGFTSLDIENHLMSLGEFCAMYLFTWSEVLWPDEFPEFGNVYTNYKKAFEEVPQVVKRTKEYSKYDKDLKRLSKFRESLPRIRRALANVPTYMIFDDHEVTDDWYLTKAWCDTILKNPLGRRVVQNALLSYAVFQAWGNTPEQFSNNDLEENLPSRGKALLDAAFMWSQSKGNDPEITRQLADRLGLPPTDNIFTFDLANIQYVLTRPAGALQWHFSITGHNFEVIFLDTRTRRAFSEKPNDPPLMLSLSALEEQIPSAQDNQKSVTILISPTPFIKIPVLHPEGLPWIARIVMRRRLKKHGIYYYDIFDHWENQDDLFETLLAKLASRWIKFNNQKSRVVVLTGDIHFAAVSRLQYQSDTLYKGDLENPSTFTKYEAVVAQFCSSAFKKQSTETRFVHNHGYVFGNTAALMAHFFSSTIEWTEYFNRKLPESSQWFGWRKPVAIGQSLKGAPAWYEHYDPPSWMSSRTPAMVKASKVGDDTIPKPHWRYRIDYIMAENEAREPAPHTPEEIYAPSPGDRKEALSTYLKLAKNHKDYARDWGSGKELVGLNNVGEISFIWKDSNKAVIQQSWWRLRSRSNNEDFLKPFPLSKFKVSFEFRDPDFEMPKMLKERPSG